MTNQLLLDTNILLDAAIGDRLGHRDALALYELCRQGKAYAGVCATSLKDVYYVLCRYWNELRARTYIRVLIDSMEVQRVDSRLCSIAVESDEPDFEDGIVRACAERWKADYIISRDEKAYANSHIKRVTAEEYLRICGG